MIASTPTCPCGSGHAYTQCCGHWHAGLLAPDAALLMRSRYCAYVLGKVSYLRETWHHSTLPDDLVLDTPVQRRWLGLTIRQHLQIDAEHAIVEFIARSRVGGGSAQRLHEIGRFVRVDGRWLYVDGKLKNAR